MNPNHQLARIEEDVAAEEAAVSRASPLDFPGIFALFDPADPLAQDPGDLERYAVELASLREAVLAVERLEPAP